MIKIINLNKIFHENTKKEFHALKNINLEIKNSSCVILKGISGSGKSTLLSLIGTLQKPTSGDIKIDEESIAKLPDLHASNFRAKNLGFIFQAYNLFNELSVKDNISIPLIPLGFSQKDIDEKVSEALKLSNIFHKKDELVFNLSGGEKQRCAIARAIVNNPEIILCDEPTANLDLNNSIRFVEILKDLKNLNKTIIVASHDPIFDDLDFVDKIIHIKNGIICE
jgi:putative ABC transport system ATP-binding protein